MRALTKEEAPKQLEKLHQPSGDILFFQIEDYDHPQIIILKAWNALESELYLAIGKLQSAKRLPSWISMRVIEKGAVDLGMTPNEIEAIRELRKVRNRVTHEIDFPVSAEEAMRFSDLSRDLILRIRTLKPDKGASVDR